MERKSFRGTLTAKADGEAGEVSAVFATLNVIDHENDVTLPGAFTDGEAVRISAWSHAWDQLPVGRGEIHERDGAAHVDGKFFLNTQTGKEHYETVKALGDLQEWSYGFDILQADEGEYEGKHVRFLRRLRVYEVSPVMLGAGIGTHTTAIKGKNADNQHANEGQARKGSPSEPRPAVVGVRVAIDQIDLEG